MTRVYTAGQGIVFKGGYGGVPGLNQQISTPADAAAAVDAQAAKGVDVIKFWLDDELGTMPKMPPEVSKAVIDAAHKHKLKVLAHIFYLADAKRVVDQGVDGLVHSVRDQPVDQALIDAMKAKGTWQLAETLSREASMFAYGVPPSEILNDPFFIAGVSPAALAELRSPERQKTVAGNPHFHDFPKFFDMAKANAKRLKDGGVPYGFGTDSGPPGRFPGYFSHWELALLVDSGFTPAEAIKAATSTAATFLNMTDLGSLAAGKQADLLVLDADPLVDIKNTRKINSVYIAGQQVPSVKPAA
jgi:imidazolonepropionase-like amidohydrolase